MKTCKFEFYIFKSQYFAANLQILFLKFVVEIKHFEIWVLSRHFLRIL